MQNQSICQKRFEGLINLSIKKEKWMTNELLTQIVRKNKMYVEWKTTPVTSADHEQIKPRFKNYEKEVRNAIQETKKRYFNRIFTAYKCVIKKTWLIINDTLSRNKNKCDLPATFNPRKPYATPVTRNLNRPRCLVHSPI